MWRVLALILLVIPATARAAPRDRSSEIATLAHEVDEQVALTSSTDCAASCRALESMRRAADHLCAIEHGDRCEQARAKVRDAIDRVRVSCPGCPSSQPESAAVVPSPPPTPPTPPPTPPPPAQSGDLHAEARTVSADSPKRGGCAGCATTSGEAPSGALALMGAIALALVSRRKRRA